MAFCILPSTFAWGWLCPAVQGSRFEVQGSEFSVFHKHTEYNPPFPPPSGWSGGTLDIPWYHPIPIDPPQHPLFDQASLSKSLSCGFAAVPRCSGLNVGGWRLDDHDVIHCPRTLGAPLARHGESIPARTGSANSEYPCLRSMRSG